MWLLRFFLDDINLLSLLLKPILILSKLQRFLWNCKGHPNVVALGNLTSEQRHLQVVWMLTGSAGFWPMPSPYLSKGWRPKPSTKTKTKTLTKKIRKNERERNEKEMRKAPTAPAHSPAAATTPATPPVTTVATTTASTPAAATAAAACCCHHPVTLHGDGLLP